ncbi:MAG: crotonase/enoyl-CoA hydratase family protein [Desulfobacteraceae bacterium]|nr:MAG: crotonase/enoyl-CoA hydratase family protein [Desulfobacteraceae bacterium]
MLVTTQKKDRICRITINREPVKNAVDAPTAKALADAFRDFEEDEESYVAILAGAGNTFCAGADLKAVSHAAEGRFNRLEPTGDGPMGPTRMVLSKPVIAAISGYAVAGGLELALWCDMRVMEETAILGVFCRRFGVPLIDGGTIRLPRLIGMSRAMDLILTGRPVKADEALSIGLVNRVVGHGQGLAAAEELAATIAAFPQTCMRNDRLSAYEQWNLSLEDALLNEFNRGMEVIRSGETLAGAGRFAQGIGKHGQFEK